MLRIAISSAAVLMLIFAAYGRVQISRLEARLVRTQPADVAKDAALEKFAASVAPAIYQEHCAACHGANLQGDRSRGAPNLADSVSVFGEGSVSDIEAIILYGIRSGHPRAHNLTDMPALGRMGQLTAQDIGDVVEFVLKMSAQPHDAAAAERGSAIYQGAGVCYDCHNGDGRGSPDYGAPALTGVGGAWLYGGDRDTLYKTIYDGRHGLCPAWIGKLSFVQIRALALYLYEKSHHE